MARTGLLIVPVRNPKAILAPKDAPAFLYMFRGIVDGQWSFEPTSEDSNAIIMAHPCGAAPDLLVDAAGHYYIVVTPYMNGPESRRTFDF